MNDPLYNVKNLKTVKNQSKRVNVRPVINQCSCLKSGIAGLCVPCNWLFHSALPLLATYADGAAPSSKSTHACTQNNVIQHKCKGKKYKKLLCRHLLLH